jgi:acyl dehydratase
MLTTTRIDELSARSRTELGVSEYVFISQKTVDGFADGTGDHQWIHTDPARAASSPFGGTVAHGYLTLALAPTLLDQVLPLGGFAMAVNYGLDKLRFPAPLPVGEQVRMRAALDAVDPDPGRCRAVADAHLRACSRRQAGLRRQRRLPGLRIGPPSMPTGVVPRDAALANRCG